MRHYPRTLFTPAVRAAQERYGSRAMGERLENDTRDDGQLGPAETAFIEERDGFYLATVNEEGWPYVQFRGGAPGFLKVLDPGRLAFADLRGNRQYISVGNLSADGRVSLFLMDYAERRRLKLLARATVHEAEEAPELAEQVVDEATARGTERIIVLEVVGFDWNCPQHITPRWTAEEWRARDLEDPASPS